MFQYTPVTNRAVWILDPFPETCYMFVHNLNQGWPNIFTSRVGVREKNCAVKRKCYISSYHLFAIAEQTLQIYQKA